MYEVLPPICERGRFTKTVHQTACFRKIAWQATTAKSITLWSISVMSRVTAPVTHSIIFRTLLTFQHPSPESFRTYFLSSEYSEMFKACIGVPNTSTQKEIMTIDLVITRGQADYWTCSNSQGGTVKIAPIHCTDKNSLIGRRQRYTSYARITISDSHFVVIQRSSTSTDAASAAERIWD